MGWHDVAVYSIYRIISQLMKAAWRRCGTKPCLHSVHGDCAGCRADAEERRRDEFAGSPEGMRLAKQKELGPIYVEYSAIEEDLRENFKLKVEDRIRRYDLKYSPGDLEAAVLRMYRAYLDKHASKVRS